MGIYAALADQDLETVCREHGGSLFSHFKNALAELAVARLGPITEQMCRLEADRAYLEGVLRDGAARARNQAATVLREVDAVIGFLTE